MPGHSRPNVADERLRRFELVTDARLAGLDVDELLLELLRRVRACLGVDTAAALLLDRSGQFLVATAACGIEEEVRQGVRIPFGRGFAGLVAAQRQAVIIDEVDHVKVLNPLLRARGIRSLLGVPLLAGGRVLGVLHVGTLVQRHFTADDAGIPPTCGRPWRHGRRGPHIGRRAVGGHNAAAQHPAHGCAVRARL